MEPTILQRRVLATAVTAMLIIAVAVALVAVLPLYERLREAQRSQLLDDARFRALAVTEVLEAARDVARQVASRTKARQQLDAFNRGEIDEATLRRTVGPILSDALGNATDLKGITRLDARGRVAVQVGAPIAQELWALPPPGARKTVLRGPLQVMDAPHLVLGAPILDRSGARVGTDVTLHALGPLRRVVKQAAESGGETTVLFRTDDGLRSVLPLADGRFGPGERLPENEPLAEIGRKGLAAGQFVQQRADRVMGAATVTGVPWVVVVFQSADEVFSGVRSAVTQIVAVVALLLLAGVTLMWRALRPLAGRIVLRVDELQHQVDRQTEALKERNNLLAAQGRQLTQLNESLELRVQRRTAALESANRQLAAFIYSASHNLRTPLRSIISFVTIVLEEYGTVLDEDGMDLLQRVERSAGQMHEVLAALLELYQLSQADIERSAIDLAEMARVWVAERQARDPDRIVELLVPSTIEVVASRPLVERLLNQVLDNAWKFTRGRAPARIEIGRVPGSEPPEFYVRDNGAGFDPAYSDKLFQPFGRLHHPEAFPGHGIGLAIAFQVVRLHDGQMRGEGAIDEGATFTFNFGATSTPPVDTPPPD